MMRFLRIALLTLVMAASGTIAHGDDKVTVRQTSNVTELEDDIRYQAELVDDMRDSISILEGQMAVLKSRLDSINAVGKDLKSQISALEKLKKEQEKGIKLATKTRVATIEARDNLKYEQTVLPILDDAYDKVSVERALAAFDDMETKDVVKRKDLVKNYGKYTKEIREFLEKQKPALEKLRWATQGSESDAFKSFQKGFKGLSYYKTYEKGQKNPSTPTIPYLDDVMSRLQTLLNQGLNSQSGFNSVLNML